MNDLSHRIEVYEPYEYEGPNPLLLSSQGLLITPDRKDAVLMSSNESIRVEGEDYNLIVLRPKFLDPIARVTESHCTVIISLVRPQSIVEVGGQYQYTDVMNWGVGKINQLGILN